MSRIIVIGASSGLGKRVAGIYAERGWNVGAAARRAEPLSALASEHPGRIVTASIDVTKPDAPDRLLDLIDRNGGADIIFNAAGTGYLNPTLDQAKNSTTVATNCDGFIRIADTAFRYFADNGLRGQFAAITSVAGTRGLGLAASYSASKRFQSTYLSALNQLRRIRKLDIHITDIRPGFVATPMLDPGRHYPMLMDPDRVARKIARAIDRRRRVAVIDCRWRMLTALWRMIPDRLWVRLPIKTSL